MAKALHLVSELENHKRGQRGRDHQRQHCVAHKRAAQEKIAKTGQRVGQQNRTTENAEVLQIRRTVRIESHPTRQQHADHVDVGQHGQCRREAGEFGEQKLRAANGFGQYRQRRAAADFPGERGGRAEYRAEQAGQQHDGQSAGLDEFHFVAEGKVVGDR